MTTFPVPGRRAHEEVAGVVGGLFERHGRMVYGVCRAMLRDPHEAEDATQQVFLSAHQALLAGADVREPGRWLATIARNECRTRIAARMRQPLPVADEDLDALPAIGDEQERCARLAEIRASLSELPERQREAVVLRYLYGLRYAEVAAALGLSRPATEALLFRARRSLRIRLKPIVGAALVVPTVVRDELALALPGFGTTGSGAAVAGATGGVIAKLAAGPVGVKAATAVVAVSTVGAVGSVSSEQPNRIERSRPARHAVALPNDAVVQPHVRRSGSDTQAPARHERRGESSSSGPGGGREGDDSSGGTTSNSGPGSGGGTSGHGRAGKTLSQQPAVPEASAPVGGSGDNSGRGGGQASDGSPMVTSSGPSDTSGSGASSGSGGSSGSTDSGSGADSSSGSGSSGGGHSGGAEPDGS